MPYATGGDADLYYEVHGTGTPILLSAGMGGSGSFWRPQMEALSRTHQVILYDHAGTGRSGRDIGPRSIAEMAGDMRGCWMQQGWKMPTSPATPSAASSGWNSPSRRPSGCAASPS